MYLKRITARIHYLKGLEGSGGGGLRERPAEVLRTDVFLRALLDELFDGGGAFYQIFCRRLESMKRYAKEPQVYALTLIAVSRGCRKFSAIASWIEKKAAETKKILQRLEAEEMITKKGSFYLIDDPLFAYWLGEIYLQKKRAAWPESQQLREALMTRLSCHYEKTDLDRDEDVLNRVETLLKSFRNDLVRLGEKKVRLPQFHETSRGSRQGACWPLKGRAQAGGWMFYVAMDNLLEEDAALLLENRKKSRQRGQKKIVITLGDLDQNAKLMLQEAGVQIWDRALLNMLFHLYNLPDIVWTKNLDGSALEALAESLR